MKILILSCARSGGTLLRRLFYAFNDVYVHNHEVNYMDNILLQDRTEYACVYKADRNSPASNMHEYNAGEVRQNMECLRKHDVKILYLIRNGKNVTGSGVCPERWLQSLEQYQTIRNLADMNIYYADVLADPDAVQAKIADQLGLCIKHRWSEYPNFVCSDLQNVENCPRSANYRLRPIDRKEKVARNWAEKLPKKAMAAFLTACQQIDQRSYF